MLTFHQIYTVQPPQLTGVGECVGRCCREDWRRGGGGEGRGVNTSCPTDDSRSTNTGHLGKRCTQSSHMHICTHTHTAPRSPPPTDHSCCWRPLLLPSPLHRLSPLYSAPGVGRQCGRLQSARDVPPPSRGTNKQLWRVGGDEGVFVQEFTLVCVCCVCEHVCVLLLAGMLTCH